MITPVITIRSSSTRYAPYTLVVDALSSTVDGFALDDCICQWDFEQNTIPSNTSGLDDAIWHPLNNRAKVSFSDPRIGSDKSTIYRVVDRDIETVSAQKGVVAAYTFYDADTYTVTLTITDPNGNTNNTSTNVTVLAANGGNGWVDKTVAASGGDYTTLAAAISFANGTSGKVRISLASNETFDVSATQSITVNDIIITTSGQNRATVRRNSAWAPGSPAGLLSIGSGVSRVYIENVSFDTNGQSLSATNIIGVDIQGTDVTVHYCYGYQLYHGVRTQNPASAIYISQNWIDQARYEMFDLEKATYSVLSGNNAYSSISNFNGLSSENGYLVSVGSSAASSGIAIQWNYLKYNGYFEYPSGFPDSNNTNTYPQNFAGSTSKGPIELSQTSDVHVYQNYLASGTSTIGTSMNRIRWCGNYASAAGQSAAMEMNGGIASLKYVNNVTKIGRGGPHGVAIYGSGSGSLTSIVVCNNTFVIDDNIRSTQAVCNFTANSRTIGSGAITFRNNAFVDNRQFLGRFIAATNSNVFSGGIVNTVFPKRREALAAAIIGGSDVTMANLRNALYVSGIHTETIKLSDMTAIFNFAIPQDDYPNAQLCSPVASVMEDFVGTVRSNDASYWSAGAVELAGVDSVNVPDDFTVNFVATPRADRPGDTLPSGASGLNGYITITDNSNGFVLMGNYASGASFDGSDELYLFTADQPDYDPAAWVGINIKTVIYFTQHSNGCDLRIVYTNTGDSEIEGNNIGSVRFYSLDMGRLTQHIDGRNLPTWKEIDNFSGNAFDTTAWTYPYDIFAPCYIGRNKDYAVGISMIADHKAIHRPFFQHTAAFTYPAYQNFTPTFKFLDDTYTTGRQRLAPGATFEVTFAVRVTKTPKEWLQVVEPWKDHYQATHGAITYANDPRPIQAFVPSQPGNAGNRFGFLTFNFLFPDNSLGKFRRQDHYGWQYTYDYCKKMAEFGYERFKMWCPAGVYLNNSHLNYPQLMLSPMFVPSSSQYEPIMPGTANPLFDSYGNAVLYPEDVPVGTTRPMIDTKDYLRRMGDELPSFIFYYGRVASVDNYPWDSGSTVNLDITDPGLFQKSIDEFDLGHAYFHTGNLGMDAFQLNSIEDDITRLETLMERLPVIKAPGTEVSPYDIISRLSPQYISNIMFDGVFASDVHYLSNYILPGAEVIMALRFDGGFFFFKNSTNWATQNDVLGMMQNWAEMGFTVLVFETVGLDSDTLYIANNEVKFDFYDAPADYPTIATPTNLRRTLYHQPLAASNYDLTLRMAIIEWDANTEPDFDHYELYKAPIVDGVSNPDGTYQLRQYLKTNIFHDPAVEESKTYYYKVKAVDIYGNKSDFSEVFSVFFIPDDPSLPAPSNLVATVATAKTSVNLTWD